MSRNYKRSGGAINPLLGRDREFQRLEGLIDHARDEGAAVALIEGETGIGKSRLAAEVGESARSRGFEVFAAAASPLEDERPFGVFRDALGIRKSAPGEAQRHVHDLLTRSVKPTDPAQTGQPTDLQFQISDEIVALVEERAALRPVVVILDDLQWADAASLMTLGALVRHLEHSALLAVATMRPAPLSHTLTRLIDELRKHPLVHLRLEPLDDRALVDLATSVMQRSPGPRLSDQLRRCSGNPLFALELIHALADEGALEIDDASVESRAAALPANLRLILLRRLSLLPKSTLDAVRDAAVLGTAFSLNDLALVTGEPVAHVYTRLRPALDADLITDDPETAGTNTARLRFRHPLIWEALYDDLPTAARALVHRKVATTLVRAGGPIEQIARHFDLGAQQGDDDAVKWLHRAGRQLGARSTEVAVHFLRRAVELASEQSLRISVSADLAPLKVLQGELDEAESLAREVLAHAEDPIAAVKLQAGLAHVLVRRGRWHDAIDQLDSGAAALPRPFDAFARAPASLVRLITGDVERAAEDAAAALEDAGELDNQVVKATSLMTLTWVHAARGDLDAAVAAGLQAVDSARRSRATFSGFLFPRLMLGGALLQSDRMEEAENHFRRAIEEAEATGSGISLPYLHSGIALAWFFTGRWDDALTEAETTLDLVESTRVRWNLFALGIQGRIAVARGEFEAAEKCLQLLEDERSHQGEIMGARYEYWIKALVLARRGSTTEAAADARAAWQCLPQLRHLFGNSTLVMDVFEVALAAQATDLIDDMSRALTKLAQGETSASLRGAAAWCRGVLDSDAETLSLAIDSFDDAGRPFDAARARESAASLYAADGDRSRQITLLGEAATTFARVGATSDEERVARRLETSGRPAKGRGRRMRPASGWESLTPTEVTVARCVVRGLSNTRIAEELVVSRHTVETHMKHIFMKLGLSSRTQLAVEGAKRAGNGAGEALSRQQ